MTNKKKDFKTFEEMFLDILREIEPATMNQLAKALKMKNPPYSTLRSLLKKGLITKNIITGSNTFTIKEKVVSYD